ncbi:hypothetical protein [Archangium violaceum]|uniref:hypothetical protein n=1 Tax=Archangium violaceum TaxID=83451 RepID=UPI0036DC0170
MRQLVECIAAELISKLTILNTNFFPDYRWHFWGRVWRTPVLGDLAMLIAFRALFVNEMTKASPAGCCLGRLVRLLRTCLGERCS